MTIQLTKDTTGGAPATYWKIKERNDNGVSTEIIIQGFFDLQKLALKESVTTFRLLELEGRNDPIKNVSSRESFLSYLLSHPDKSPYEAASYIMEKYIIANVPGWDKGEII